jgi:hypothetical protein
MPSHEALIAFEMLTRQRWEATPADRPIRKRRAVANRLSPTRQREIVASQRPLVLARSGSQDR